jgi:MinD superfamily P-loop ATPase
MDRKNFIKKGTVLFLLTGLSVAGFAIEDDEKKFTVLGQRCDGCGHCFKSCRDKALTASKEGKAVIDSKKCKGCGDCAKFCRRVAIVEMKN